MPINTPWAVLLCLFADKNDSAPFEPVLKINNLFTSTGDGLFNVTRYFRENSHGTLDLTGSQVFGPFVVPGTKAGVISGPSARNAAMDAARRAALSNGVPLGTFQFVCVIFNDAIGGNQGATGWGTVAPLPGVITDYRYALNNGTSDFGHEMGHAYGLQHSRLGALDEPEGEAFDYQDKWDVMSYNGNLFAADPNFGERGPGLNAWNMRSRGWLDESRVWRTSMTTFEQIVQLRPLHRRDLTGFLAAELPPNDGLGGHGRYLVEYRINEGWDVQFPRSAVFVHRYSAAHSYLLTGMQGALWLSSQNGPNGGFGGWQLVGTAVGLGAITIGHNADGRLELFALDATEGSAWHNWQVTPNGDWHGWQIMGDARGLNRLAVTNNANGRLEVFATDNAAGLAWHNWQVTPNGDWHGWQVMGGAKGLGEIAIGRNADGRLELFALDASEGSAWHNWQVTPNGDWQGWQIMGDARGLNRLVVTNNANGRLEVFATDNAAGLAWHNWQVTPNGDWHGWQVMGGAKGLGEIAIGRNADGRLDLFAVDTSDKLVWRTTQTSANSDFGPWALAVEPRGGFGHIAVVAQANGALCLIAVDTVGQADVVAGETLHLGMNGGPNVQVQVVNIDDANRVASVRLISHV